MSLSERVRPNVEAAPWVCKEIAALESQLAAERERVKKYEDAIRFAPHEKALLPNGTTVMVASVIVDNWDAARATQKESEKEKQNG